MFHLLCLLDKLYTAQKTKFFINDFVSNCYQIRSFLWIWSHLLKKYLMANLNFCVELSAIGGTLCSLHSPYFNLTPVIINLSFAVFLLPIAKFSNSSKYRKYFVCIFTGFPVKLLLAKFVITLIIGLTPKWNLRHSPIKKYDGERKMILTS